MDTQVHNNYYKQGNDEDEAYLHSMVACGSYIIRWVLDASIQLGLFEIIDKFGHGVHVSAFEIASRLQTRNAEEAARVLEPMLRVLATQSFLTSSTTAHASTTKLHYGIAPKGKLFVADERGVSMAQYYSLTVLHESSKSSIRLKDAVLEGGNLFENFHPYPSYEHLESNLEATEIFNVAIGSHSTLTSKQVLKVYNGFEGLHTLVDVGGGNGTTLDIIISKYPSISGINLDSPAVIRAAPTYKGVQHVSGDMFVEVPKGDAIILKYILHNWGYEECVKLLNNCHKALPKKGKVIVMENLLPEIPQTDVYSQHVSLFNMLMLSMNGKERTKADYEAMAMEVGFAEFKLVCCAYGLSVMELIKF